MLFLFCVNYIRDINNFIYCLWLYANPVCAQIECICVIERRNVLNYTSQIWFVVLSQKNVNLYNSLVQQLGIAISITTCRNILLQIFATLFLFNKWMYISFLLFHAWREMKQKFLIWILRKNYTMIHLCYWMNL